MARRPRPKDDFREIKQASARLFVAAGTRQAEVGKAAFMASQFFEKCAEYLPIGTEDGRRVRTSAVLFAVMAGELDGATRLISVYTDQAKYAGLEPNWAEALRQDYEALRGALPVGLG